MNNEGCLLVKTPKSNRSRALGRDGNAPSCLLIFFSITSCYKSCLIFDLIRPLLAPFPAGSRRQVTNYSYLPS
jgi:hypothetical protein